jgi:transcriptional regulator with XRE-family HTH domain
MELKERPAPLAGFPERLRQLRTARNLSQEDLGTLTGIHHNHLGRYERGLSQPTAETLRVLADALKVSSDYLLSGAQEDYARARFADQELLRMFQAVEAFPDDEKAAVKDLLDALITRRRVRELSAQPK